MAIASESKKLYSMPLFWQNILTVAVLMVGMFLAFYFGGPDKIFHEVPYTFVSFVIPIVFSLPGLMIKTFIFDMPRQAETTISTEESRFLQKQNDQVIENMAGLEQQSSTQNLSVIDYNREKGKNVVEENKDKSKVVSEIVNKIKI